MAPKNASAATAGAGPVSPWANMAAAGGAETAETVSAATAGAGPRGPLADVSASAATAGASRMTTGDVRLRCTSVRRQQTVRRPSENWWERPWWTATRWSWWCWNAWNSVNKNEDWSASDWQSDSRLGDWKWADARTGDGLSAATAGGPSSTRSDNAGFKKWTEERMPSAATAGGVSEVTGSGARSSSDPMPSAATAGGAAGSSSVPTPPAATAGGSGGGKYKMRGRDASTATVGAWGNFKSGVAVVPEPKAMAERHSNPEGQTYHKSNILFF